MYKVKNIKPAWFGLQAMPGQARPGQTRPGAGCSSIFSLAGQAALVRPGQAAGQARLEKSGLLAALMSY